MSALRARVPNSRWSAIGPGFAELVMPNVKRIIPQRARNWMEKLAAKFKFDRMLPNRRGSGIHRP